MKDLRDLAWASFVSMKAVMGGEDAASELRDLLAEDDGPHAGLPDGSVPMERWW
jgi:hypothetical protein